MSSQGTSDDDIREMRLNPKISSAAANKKMTQANERTKNMKPGANSQKSPNTSTASNQSEVVPSDETEMLAGSDTRGSDKNFLKKPNVK
jgi:hypothetical protein